MHVCVCVCGYFYEHKRERKVSLIVKEGHDKKKNAKMNLKMFYGPIFLVDSRDCVLIEIYK